MKIIKKEIVKEYPWKEKWTSRNKLIASKIKDYSSVIDIGGGLCELKKFLEPCYYCSIDKSKWTDDTIVADLNINFPSLAIFDIIVCQGVLEYIHEPIIFLRGIKMYGDTLILTYRNGEMGKSLRYNNYKQEVIKEFLKLAHWQIIDIQDSVSKLEKIYICKAF